MYRRPLGPKQRKAVRELGSPKLRSWCASGSLEAPDAASAWAHLSDVLDRIRFDEKTERSVHNLVTAALRQACKER